VFLGGGESPSMKNDGCGIKFDTLLFQYYVCSTHVDFEGKGSELKDGSITGFCGMVQ
jgi:hypothetical protein